MSQATLLPSSPVAPSFPPLVYHGVPVLTTEMLAQAYEVEAKQIRQNFANNRERFIEGKHFFQLSGNDLREFKNYVENFDLVQIDKRARHFTLWTERGAARNAKMLNSDRAWDVFELLEETFFRVVRKESESRPLADDMVLPVSPDRPSRRTDPERKQLTAIINTWVSMAPIHYASARAQVNAHFGVASVDALTVAQVREAIQWVQAKIDALPPVPERIALPAPEKDKFEAYLEQVEVFRARTNSEIRRLLKEGLLLVDVYKFGPEGIEGFSSIFHSWLREVAGSPSPLVASYWSMGRAIECSPLYLVREMEKILPRYQFK